MAVLVAFVGALGLVPTTRALAATGSLVGTVTDATTHAAIAGATVTTQPATSTATTDQGGGFSLSVASGTYYVIVTSPQYDANDVSAGVPSGGTATVAIALTPVPALSAQDLFTRPPQTGIGTATDGHTWTDDLGSNPKDAVSISANKLSVSVPAGSQYDAYTGLSYRDQVVAVDANVGSSGLAVLARVQGAGTWLMLAVNPTQNTIVLWTAVNGTYRQLTQYAGAPAIQANTTYHIKLATAGSTVMGKIWAIGGPEPAWQVTATQTAITAAGLAGIRVTSSAVSFLSWTESPLTQLSGSVTDAGSGQPIAGATVAAGGGPSATADSNGAYVLPLAAGSYSVTASATGYGSSSTSVTVSTGLSAVAGFALPAGPPPPPPSGNSTITGVVVDDTTGAPLTGVRMTTVPATGSVTTDSTGAFTLSVNAGSYAVVASLAGYDSTFQSVTSTAGGTTSASMRLAVVPPQFAEDQFTRPDQSGIGVATDGHTYTDDHAVYPAGVEQISSRRLLVQTATQSSDFDAWMGQKLADQEVTEDVLVQKGGGARILARVQDGGDMVVGVFNTNGQVQLWAVSNTYWTQVASGSTSLSTNVWYHLKLDVSGSQVTAKAWAFGSAEPGWQASGTQSILTGSGQAGLRVAQADVLISHLTQRPLNTPTGGVTGNVTQSGGQPVGGATVTLTGGTTTSSNTSGAYSLSALLAGTYTEAVSAAGFQTAYRSVTVTAGTTVTANVTLSPTAGAVSGTVTNASTSQPVTGATVSLGNAASTTADAQGGYVLASLAPGTYTLTVTAAGYVTASQSVTVTSGQTTAANVALTPAGAVTGTVSDSATSQPVAGATVSLSGGGGSTTTDATGAFSLAGVPAGSYTMTVSATGYQPASATVTVTGGQTASVSVTLTQVPGTVGGKVTDAGSGAALAGATAALSGGGGSTTTDAQGAFSLANVPPGGYTLTVTAAGYQTATSSVTVSAGQTVTVAVALTPVPGSVAGTVTDAATAQPVAGATVSLSGAAGSTTTDAQGAYALGSVPPGTYTLTVTASGYVPATQSVTLGSGQTATANVALSSAGAVGGTVTDAATAQPVGGAAVSLSGGGATTTDPTGAFSLTGVPAGTYTMTVSAAGYLTATSSVTVTAGQTTGASVALTAAPGSVAGTVTDAGSGAAIAGAAVSLSGGAGSTTTSAQGGFTLGNVPAGTYTLTVSAAGYQTATSSVTVAAGQTATAAVALTPAPGTVSGTVTDAVTAQPIAGAAVSLSGGGGSATTSAQGAYAVGSVPPGSYTLTVTASGYVTATQSVTVSSGQTTTVNMTMTTPPGAVSGTVTDGSTGQALAGASLSLSGAAGSAVSTSAGTYSITGVTAGTYTLTVSAGGYTTLTEAVSVASGATTTVNPVLTPAPGTLTGTVSDATTAAAIPGATVTTQPPTTTATTDAGGAWSITAPPGTYNVLITAAGYNANFGVATARSSTSTAVSVSLVAVPPGIAAEDLFSRPNQSGIGTASDGHSWTDDLAQNPTASVGISNRQLAVQTASGVSYDAWMGVAYQDQEVTADFTVASGSGARLMARVQGAGSWVLVAVNPGSGLVLWVVKSNSWTNLASAGVPVALNTAYHAKLDVIGTQVSAKVWPVGSAEPAWQVTATQSILTGTGTAGLRTAGASVSYWSLTQTPITQISGTVTTSAGSVIAGCPVSLSTGAQTTTDSAGRFSFVQLAAGTYTVTASPQGLTPSAQTVTIAVGAGASLRFRF